MTPSDARAIGYDHRWANNRVAGVVLAAGASNRLGTPKQLLSLAGRPVLAHTLDALRRSVLDPRLLILGFQAEEIARSVDVSGFQVVDNPDYALGQSTSVRAATLALADDIDAAVFILGDQPEVEATIIDAIASHFRATGAPIVQPRYAEGRGNPVLVSRALFPQLLNLTGDTGARPLIVRYAEQVELLDVSSCHRPGDIDTWDDYAAMKRRFKEAPTRGER